jgi:hypothetical protein
MRKKDQTVLVRRMTKSRTGRHKKCRGVDHTVVEMGQGGRERMTTNWRSDKKILEQKKFGKDIDNIGQEYDQISAGRWQAEYS